MDLKKYARLKEDVEAITRDLDREAGRQQQLRKELASEFDCSTVEEARSLLKKKQKKKERSSAAYEEALAAFETQHADKLNGRKTR